MAQQFYEKLQGKFERSEVGPPVRFVEASSGTEKSLKRADTDLIVCVDERNVSRVLSRNITLDKLQRKNPINYPGAMWGGVDGVAKVLGISVETARQLWVDHKLPLGSHPECGYGNIAAGPSYNLVSPEQVDFEERHRLTALYQNALIPEYDHGFHHIRKAVINYRRGTSIDQDQRVDSNTMSYDAWFTDNVARAFRMNAEQTGRLHDHMTHTFLNVVHTLNPNINTFEVVAPGRFDRSGIIFERTQ